MITLKQLKHLQAICQYGSLQDAAKAIHLTRSALTRSLHNLEEILGLALFERKTNGMQPTDFCLNVLAQSEKVLLAVKDIQRDADMECNIEQGSLVILVGAGARSLILRQVLPKFALAYPNIEVRISEAMPDEAKELLLKREADFLISGDGSFSRSEDFTFEIIKSIPVFILVRKGHPILEKELNLVSLLSYPLVTASYFSPEHPFIKKISEKFKIDIKVTPKIVCSDNIALKEIVLNSDSWLVSPKFNIMMDTELDDGQLASFTFGDLELKTDISTIELADRSRSPAAKKFLKMCHEYFDNIEL
ncbi:MAG: LysR family transcriptional regulator [Bermanella sp.]